MTTTTAFPVRLGCCPGGCPTPARGDLVRYHGTIIAEHGIHEVRRAIHYGGRHRFLLFPVDATGAPDPRRSSVRGVRLESIAPHVPLTWTGRNGWYESDAGHTIVRYGRRWMITWPGGRTADVECPTLRAARDYVAQYPNA